MRAHDDGRDAMREWHWRCYTDHLEDLGYDLDGGEPHDEARLETGDAAERGGGPAPSALP